MANITIKAVDTDADTITVEFGIDKSVQTFHGLATADPETALSTIMQTAADYETNYLSAQTSGPSAQTAAALVGQTFAIEQPEPAAGPLVS